MKKHARPVQTKPPIDDSQIEHGTFKSYLIGFSLSIVLTLCSFGIVAMGWFDFETRLFTIVSLAIAQVVVQLVYFFNLGNENHQWNLSAFFFMLLVVGILVLGTFWIMYNLNERTMPNMNEKIKTLTDINQQIKATGF